VEIQAFLTHLAVERMVSSSTQNQALNALVFLYQEVLGLTPGDFGAVARAKPSYHLPVVLTRDEVQRLLAAVSVFDYLTSFMKADTSSSHFIQTLFVAYPRSRT
jgi:site-specific recombinase XerD